MASAAALASAVPARAGVAVPADDESGPTGPNQKGRGVHGQYVYWVTMPMPCDETVASLGLKRPTDFTREELCQLIVNVHDECGIEILETAGFLEVAPTTVNLHQNCLLRAKDQFRWLKLAEKLLSD